MMNQAVVDYIIRNESLETQDDMAKHLGVSQRTISRYLHKLGIQSRGKAKPERIEDIEFTFANFYKKYYPLSMWLALKYMRDKNEAEEIVSISFIYLLNNKPSFYSEQGLVAYLKKTIKSRAKNRLRDLQAGWRRSKLIEPGAFRIHFDGIEDKKYYEEITSELLEMLMADLRPTQKKVVALRMKGFTEKQISETLNIRRSNISTYWIAAINRMKRKLLKMPQYREISFHR